MTPILAFAIRSDPSTILKSAVLDDIGLGVLLSAADPSVFLKAVDSLDRQEPSPALYDSVAQAAAALAKTESALKNAAKKPVKGEAVQVDSIVAKITEINVGVEKFTKHVKSAKDARKVFKGMKDSVRDIAGNLRKVISGLQTLAEAVNSVKTPRKLEKEIQAALDQVQALEKIFPKHTTMIWALTIAGVGAACAGAFFMRN